jgi:hypothetical protein
MAINDAFRALKRTNAEEYTDNSSSITQLPANILEAFIPGYSLISKLLLDALGFDISLLVSVCFLAFGVVTGLTFAWKIFYRLFEQYCMSFIRIDSDDDMYEHIMGWLTSQRISRNSRKLMAKSGRENAWDMIDSDAAVQALDPNNLMNFNNWDARVPPQFQPSFGSHRFFHKGSLFQFKREEKQVMASSGWGGLSMRDGMLYSRIIPLSPVFASLRVVDNVSRELNFMRTIYREFRPHGEGANFVSSQTSI